MKEDTELKETTSRREITKAAVIAAVAAPIAAVLASCTNQPTPGGEATPSASPAPTRPKRDGGDSPIIVGGGGSVIIDFDESDYVPDNAQAPTKYTANFPLQKIIYLDKHGIRRILQSIAGIKTSVKFDVKETGGASREITIDSDPTATPPTTVIGSLVYFPVDGTLERHLNANGTLKKVKINSVDNSVDAKGTIILM